eukprot:m.1363243 g.1363243  ORF g.1363243 m.1363243 type:complete len:74 (+) comp24945_c1_seq1:1421-1642(+)
MTTIVPLSMLAATKFKNSLDPVNITPVVKHTCLLHALQSNEALFNSNLLFFNGNPPFAIRSPPMLRRGRGHAT